MFPNIGLTDSAIWVISPKRILNSNLTTTTPISVAKSFRKFALSTAVQNFKTLWQLSNKLLANEIPSDLSSDEFWTDILYCNSLMMTSSNGNIFRVTGTLCGEFTGPGEFPTQRPVTRSFDVFFDLRLNKRLSKQPWGWWFETPSLSLWHHCNAQGGLHSMLVGNLPYLSMLLRDNLAWYHTGRWKIRRYIIPTFTKRNYICTRSVKGYALQNVNPSFHCVEYRDNFIREIL